ncbi:unnamed protein product [Symbiodinium sp. KB8]|nr:unnamed protein product [Symbiodinium sp. KB8]
MMDATALLTALAAAQQQNAPAAPPPAAVPPAPVVPAVSAAGGSLQNPMTMLLMQSLLQQVQQAAPATVPAPATASPVTPAAAKSAASSAPEAPLSGADMQKLVAEAVAAEMQKRDGPHGSLARDEKFQKKPDPHREQGRAYMHLHPKPKVAAASAKPKQEEDEGDKSSGSKDKPPGRKELQWCTPSNQNPPNKNRSGDGKLLRIASMDWGDSGTEVLEFYARIVPKGESALARKQPAAKAAKEETTEAPKKESREAPKKESREAPKKESTEAKANRCKREFCSPPVPKRLKFEPESEEEGVSDQEPDPEVPETSNKGSDDDGEDGEDKAVPGSEDEDIFKGKFTLKEPPKKLPTSASKSEIQTPGPADKKCHRISDSVMDTIPDSVPASDRKHWADILKQERLFTLEDVMENIAELDRTPARNYTLFLVAVFVVVCLSAVANLGDILEALGEKAVASFQKMTLKSKKMFKQWPTTLKELQSVGPSVEAIQDLCCRMEQWLASKMKEFGECLGGLSLTPHFSVFLLIPEALLDDVRSRAASFGAVIRPRIFSAPDVVPADEEAQEIATPEKASPSSSSKKPAVVEHSDYQTMFLRTRRPKTGVLEFALVADPGEWTEGYTCLWRTEEVWLLQSCKSDPKHQRAALAALEMLAGNCLPPSGHVELLPSLPVCRITWENREVNLADWSEALNFFEWSDRWRRCQILTEAQRKLQTGVSLALMMFFVLRQNFAESCCDRCKAGRLQKRMIHSISQLAEHYLLPVLTPTLPLATNQDEFHPAMKSLGRGKRNSGKHACLSVKIQALRDGRSLRNDLKQKHIFSLDRWLNRSTGCLGTSADETLTSVGLQDMVPSHPHRLTGDFLYRYWLKAANELRQDMKSQSARSLLIMADASPKGKLDVWSPIVFCGRAAACMPLQRMSDLLASTASVETKLQEAQRAADSFAELSSAAQAVGQKKKLLLGSKEKTVPISCLLLPLAHSSRRPKAISTIRQKKLAAREQLQALLHTLNMLDLELKLPEHGLHAADTANGEVRISSPDGCFLWNANTGHAVWDKILEDDLQASMDDVLCQLFGTAILRENNYDHLAEDRNAFEKEGLNVFATLSADEPSTSGQTNQKIVDLCIREPRLSTQKAFKGCSHCQRQQRTEALVDEEAHCLFDAMQSLTEMWSDVCIRLVAWSHLCSLCMAARKFRWPSVCSSKQSKKSKLDCLQQHTCFCNSTAMDRMLEQTLHNALGLAGLQKLGVFPDLSLQGSAGSAPLLLGCGVHEITSYRLYLKSCPAVMAALLCEEPFEEVPDVAAVKASIMQEVRREWEVVLEMEASEQLAPLLKKHSPHTDWQCYREVTTAVEEAQYTTTPACRSVLRAWFPSFTQSANVEEQFNYMQDALKRATKSQKGSMTTLSSVAVKALNQKVLQEGQAQPVTLSAKDWEGPMTRGGDVIVDKILSEFVSTSAHNHNRSTLNYMRGFIMAKRQEVAFAHAADNFWVASAMQRNTLFSVAGKFFLCIGTTPGIVNALPLRELEMVFRGPKPEEAVDEEHVPCKAPVWETTEILQTDQTVKALPVVEELLLDFCQDRIGESTTLQFCKNTTPPVQLGSSVLFRRCEAAKPLLVWLMSSHGIVKVLSEALSRILSSYGARLRQNASKSQKIRTLMKLPVVQEGCSSESLAALDKLLTAMDDKRRKKAKQNEEDEEEEEPEAWEFMNEPDEAWNGAKQLLEMLNKEDDP